MWHAPLAPSVCIDTILSQKKKKSATLRLSNWGTPGDDWMYALLCEHNISEEHPACCVYGYIATRKLSHRVESSRGLVAPKHSLTLSSLKPLLPKWEEGYS